MNASDHHEPITLDDPEDSPGARNEAVGASSARSRPSVEPIAWLADIESPEEALPTWVLARIDRTAERYRHRWTEQQTAAFRRQMAWTLATHPRVRRLVDIVEGAKLS